MPHDAHLSPVNSYDPGRDPAIGLLADAAVGPDSGSLVAAAAGNATGLEPSFPLRGEPHIATIVGPADVSTGGGPLALAAIAVAGVGSYAGGSAFILGLTPVALDGQPLPVPVPQGTNRTSRISACGSAGAASAVKAPTCDMAAHHRAAGRPISTASAVSLGLVSTDGPPRDAPLPASRTHRNSTFRPGGVLAAALACRRGASGIAIGNRAASPFHHGLLVASVACLGGSDCVATQPVCQQPVAPSPNPPALLDYSDGGEAGAGSRLDPTIAHRGGASPRLPGLSVTGGASLDGLDRAASPTRSRTTRRARTTVGGVPVESPTGAVPPTCATIVRHGCASPRLPGLFVTGGNSLDGPICAASRPADSNSFILIIGDIRIGSHPYALPPSRGSGGRRHAASPSLPGLSVDSGVSLGVSVCTASPPVNSTPIRASDSVPGGSVESLARAVFSFADSARAINCHGRAILPHFRGVSSRVSAVRDDSPTHCWATRKVAATLADALGDIDIFCINGITIAPGLRTDHPVASEDYIAPGLRTDHPVASEDYRCLRYLYSVIAAGAPNLGAFASASAWDARLDTRSGASSAGALATLAAIESHASTADALYVATVTSGASSDGSAAVSCLAVARLDGCFAVVHVGGRFAVTQLDGLADGSSAVCRSADGSAAVGLLAAAQLDGLECPHHIDHAKRTSGRHTEGAWRSKERFTRPSRLNAIVAYAISSKHHANSEKRDVSTPPGRPGLRADSNFPVNDVSTPPGRPGDRSDFTERARLLLRHNWREPTHVAPGSHASAVTGPWTELAKPDDEVNETAPPPAPRQPAKPLSIQGKAERAARNSVADARVIAVAHAVERLDSSTFEPGDDLRPTRRTCVPAAIANGDRSVPAAASQHTGVAPEDHDRGRIYGPSDPNHPVCDASSTPGGLGCRSDSLFPVNAALDRGLTPASGAIIKFGHPRPGLHVLAASTSAGPRDPSGHAQAMRQDAQRGDAAWFTAELEELGNHSGRADDPRFVERFIRGQCTMEECVEAGSTWCYVTFAEARRIALQHGKEFTTTRATWVYKTKRNGKHKARCCLDGSSQRFGENYNQTFCSTLRMPSLRLLLNVAARRGLKARRRDLVAAFLQGVLEDGEIAFMQQPAGHAHALDAGGRPKLCLILKPLYGMKQAGRRFQRSFFGWLGRARDDGGAGLTQSKEDPCIYRIASEDDELIIGVYVDDLIIFYKREAEYDAEGNLVSDSFYARFVRDIEASWKSEDEGPLSDILNVQVTPLAGGGVHVGQGPYVRKLLDEYLDQIIAELPNPAEPGARHSNNTPFTRNITERVQQATDDTSERELRVVRLFQSCLGALLYLVTNTRPDIALPIGLLCRAMAKPTPALFEEVYCVLCYLREYPDLGLTYNGRGESAADDELHAFSDADWSTRRSTSGWLVRMWGATLDWRVQQQPTVSLSSCQAEIMSASEATKDVEQYRRLQEEVDALPDGSSRPPTKLYVDNQAAIASAYNPEHHGKLKHVERRHFYIREAIEAHRLCVPFVRSDANLADFFTKPLHPKRFFELRDKIMNVTSPVMNVTSPNAS